MNEIFQNFCENSKKIEIQKIEMNWKLKYI